MLIITMPTNEYRYLILPGETGTIACRVYGIDKNTLPSRSPEGRFGWGHGTYLRMKNLIVVRGPEDDQTKRMLGPGDYYTNLENPHAKGFTIDIQDGFPIFHEHPLKECLEQIDKKPIDNCLFKTITADWISGHNKELIKTKEKEYPGQTFDSSLFENSGLLEIDTDDAELKLPKIDNPEQYDLSSFNVRLVANNSPFQITDKKLRWTDEYRPVSYDFGENYAQHVIKNGGGLFLESHKFIQTMTPLDEQSSGFITLGRWHNNNQSTKQLELIALKIPLGYTLIVNKDAIHGDTTFVGMYMMAMTSNHITMQSADTVFLKHKSSKMNYAITSDYTFHNQENCAAPKTTTVSDTKKFELDNNIICPVNLESIKYYLKSLAHWITAIGVGTLISVVIVASIVTNSMATIPLATIGGGLMLLGGIGSAFNIYQNKDIANNRFSFFSSNENISTPRLSLNMMI